MNFYPEQLRRIADICEGFNKIDGEDAPETCGTVISIKNGVRLVDADGTFYGELWDEVGGAWSFVPRGEQA